MQQHEPGTHPSSKESVDSPSQRVADIITTHLDALRKQDSLEFTRSLQNIWPFHLDGNILVKIWQQGHEIIDPEGDVRGGYPPIAMPLAAVYIGGRAMEESSDERWLGFAEKLVGERKLPSWMQEDPAENYRLTQIGVKELSRMCDDLLVPDIPDDQKSPEQLTSHVVRDNMANGLLPIALILDYELVEPT